MTYRTWQPVAAVLFVAGLAGSLSWVVMSSGADPSSIGVEPVVEPAATTSSAYWARFSASQYANVVFDTEDGTVCYDLRNLEQVGRLYSVDILHQETLINLGNHGDSPFLRQSCAVVDDGLVEKILGSPGRHHLVVGFYQQNITSSPLEDGPPRASECGRPFPFTPSWLPHRFFPHLFFGSGGMGSSPLPHPEAEGHFQERAPGEGGSGIPAFIDVDTTGGLWRQSHRRLIEVLGNRATLGWIHEGYSVEFDHEGCGYSLNAYGISQGALRRFAEGLGPIRATWIYMSALGLPAPRV